MVLKPLVQQQAKRKVELKLLLLPKKLDGVQLALWNGSFADREYVGGWDAPGGTADLPTLVEQRFRRP